VSIGKSKNKLATQKKMGRPTDFNVTLADEICERISQGESLRDIGRDERMPAAGTICRWLNEKPNFDEQYTRAKLICGENEFDDIKEITDAKPHYYYDEAGNKRIDPAWVNLQRLRADKRQWRASKLDRKKYGDSLAVKAEVKDTSSTTKWLDETLEQIDQNRKCTAN